MVSPTQSRPQAAEASARADPRFRVGSAPEQATVQIVLRAGADEARTRKTLSGIDPAHRVLLVADAEHPLRRGPGAASLSFAAPQSTSPPAALSGETAGLTVLVEDGAILPRGWEVTVRRHLGSPSPPDVLAAVTNHASGPERVEASELLRRASSGAWQELAERTEQRWRGAREDVETVSSPLLVLRNRGAIGAGVGSWWSGVSERLPLPHDAVLSIAHDLAVMRSPSRGVTSLGAEVREPDLPQEQQAPQALARLADARPAKDTPGHPRLHRQLAEALTRLGDSPRGVAHAQACLGGWPRHVDARLWLTQAWIRSGNLERARRGIDAVQQEVPLHNKRKAHLLACLGELWRLSGDGRQAEQCLDKALELDALQPLALDSRGLLELEAGGFDGSIRFFRQAVRSDPYFASAWSDYGRALAMSGQLELARTALARALALHPGDREARRLLTRISPNAPGS